MTNRRRGGKTHHKSTQQRNQARAQADAANRIVSIPRPTLNPVCTAIKVELAVQAAECRRKHAKT